MIRELGEQTITEDVVDPGTPFTHSLEEQVADAVDKGKGAKGADDEDDQPTLKELQAQMKTLQATSEQNRRDAEYWAGIAQRGQTRGPELVAEEVIDPEPEETAEALLDDISTLGAKALAKRGYVKMSDVEKFVDSKISETVEQVTAGGQFDSMLNREFPELADTKSPLFIRTQQHYREMIQQAPESKGSKVALLSAAKLAKIELATESRNVADTEEERLERIHQQGGKNRRPADGDRDEFRMSPQASQIVQNLSRFLDPKDRKNANAAVMRFQDVRPGKSDRTGTR